MSNKHNKKKMNRGLTAKGIFRVAGLSAVVAGLLYIVIQFIHPPDDLSSVNSSSWVMVACLTLVMSLSSLIGMTGVYMRQVKEAGWLGLIGILLFGLFWLISFAFSFIEAFVMPLLTADAGTFVEGMLGIFDGTESTAHLGIFPALAGLAGGMYILGGLLLGIAIFRARVLPRMAGILLACASAATLATSIIPHPLDRMMALPMGVALIWLGYALYVQSNILNRQEAF
ncbi:hypothetical protein PUW24_07005 [Paenibacillus urinalis]|uniref:DUF4386 family protein n=1 Tax=Paenibacillus urinalis TaxID=521520 RepID=A0ABY7X974_9BACL|nr:MULTISPECIES: hypothetical protein [Paenibacillus]WDH98663.1 hypothetical protein PUW24_07005 [Paenibacillus urinalis]WDI02357.1 hypothetical protein PUW25_24730 [Paenibacillus urinalis]GAK41562.1 hypothetical protein TCA2_4053 [Paenibacillus sp. TCA20]